MENYSSKKISLYTKKAGADFIKFQIYNFNEIATSKLKKHHIKKNSINKMKIKRRCLKVCH